MTPKHTTWECAVESLRRSKSQTHLARACYYDDPILDAAIRFTASAEWKAVCYLLRNSKGRVLDLGAGRGISSFAFAKHGWQVTALEPDPSSIVGAAAIRELTIEANLKIDVVEEWGESLPFDDNFFDVLYGRAVFHHANDLAKFCSEAARVLKPGGELLLTREHVISDAQELETFLDSHPLHNLYGGESAYLLEQYLSAISDAKLKIQQVLGPHSTPINYYPESYPGHLRKLSNRLGKRLGRPGRVMAKMFVKIPPIRHHVESTLNREDNYPGRLYSFHAVKQ